MERFLTRHGASFPHIKAVYYDPFGECSNSRQEIHGISLMVRPLLQGIAVLLHASHRLTPAALRNLATIHPGECIVILEKHPESRLRQALNILAGEVDPRVARVLAMVLRPGG